MPRQVFAEASSSKGVSVRSLLLVDGIARLVPGRQTAPARQGYAVRRNDRRLPVAHKAGGMPGVLEGPEDLSGVVSGHGMSLLSRKGLLGFPRIIGVSV